MLLGDGKTFYIQKELRRRGTPSVTIAVNEAFSVGSAITKLRELPQERNCSVYFNFTLIPPGVSDYKRQYALGSF